MIMLYGTFNRHEKWQLVNVTVEQSKNVDMRARWKREQRERQTDTLYMTRRSRRITQLP